MSQFRRLFSSFTLRQQISIGVALVVVGVGLWAFSKWNTERDFRPLYANLAADDAGAVMQKLKEEGVEYRVDDAGATLRVPSGKVAELRLRMASAGLPKTGRIGFELFDQTNLGMSEFAEQVNFRRAIEGELERSIVSLAEVERARVHISLPKDSVFLEARQEAKASVILKLRPRATLAPQHAVGISFLVASAVDRLSPDAVTVLDSDGNLLIRPRRNSAEGGDAGSGAALEYRQQVEKDLVRKVRTTLEPLLGPDNFTTQASVECELATTEESEETYDPNKTAVLTAQKSEDIAGAPQTAGVPGTAANLPRPPVRGAGTSNGISRKMENITYQASRVVRRVSLPRGTVTRISLSVLVAQTVRWQGVGAKARRIVEPLSPERLQAIKDLVTATAGLSKDRGDQLTVESQPFEAALHMEPPQEPAPLPGPPAPSPFMKWLEPYLVRIPMPVRIGAAAAGVLMLLAPAVWLVLRRRKKRKAAGVDAAPAEIAGESAGQEIAPGASYEDQFAAQQAERKRLEVEALNALQLAPIESARGEVLTKHLRSMAQNDPKATAQILRGWINEKAR
jgi:flagellar M-ring protein FliF